ncbi:filamentous hemagglutinin N-terminal domain-containing protein [Verrucomicrobiaceae bacterium N1E253]|uniref:Filamentous hemagglutinin N-terminal domain-containing protein n=1 Tax=Oceaniferula marina TaxID=2748318 RepID=A0A851GEN1_9BACT|nr:MBG domain-containing protein [Oceaniferula marina]NWK55876.1 filamentous hemagglutinin N-terminal domain-containing protein [Oceaniferula marina]
MKHRYSPYLCASNLLVALTPLTANPIDPNPSVVAGQVEFSGLTGHNAIITQESQKAIVDYARFNVPEGNSVQFIQPNSNAALLNRITGADPSTINGSLTANGQVYFVNPAGVTFGANSVIRADMFMAVAGQVSNADFLNSIQRFNLTGNINNQGSIVTERGVGLFGQQVTNTGEIVAKNGYAIIASGDEVHVRQGGTSLAVDVTDSAKSSKPGTGIRNMGTVDGEEVMFSAGDAFATAIQQSGTVKARKSVKIHSDQGAVEVSGSVTARDDKGNGGVIEVGGTDLGADTAPSSSSTLIAESAVLDASSDSGKGGHIVVWSDGHTDFSGTANVSSRNGEGGFLETSGKTINFSDVADRIIVGWGGQFLIDPTDVLIDGSLAGLIETSLNNGSNVEVVTSAPGTDQGDITVAANILVPTNNLNNKGALTLIADRDIVVQSGVTVSNIQEDFAVGETVFNFQAGRNIDISGDVRHSGIGASTGRGSILMTAGGNIDLNNAFVDSNGGSVIMTADQINLIGFSSSITAGLNGESTAIIDLTATSKFEFSGGNIQTYGGADVFIDAGQLVNGTGSQAISFDDQLNSFYAIRLPNPTDDGSGNNHTYGGLQSDNRATYNVTDFNVIKTAGISALGYYYSYQPTMNITANDGSKIYGDTFPAGSGAGVVTVNTNDFVTPPLGDPFTQDTILNTLDLTGVTTTSTGAPAGVGVGSAPIIATGASSDNGYAINYNPGTLTINKRAVTLTASEQNKQYGDILTLDNTAFVVADLGVEGNTTLPNGDQIDTVILTSATGVDVSTTSIVNTYTDEIVITGQAGSGGFDSANYAFTYVKGDLKVNRRNVTVTASEQTKYYGDVLDLDSAASQSAFTILDGGLTGGGDATLPNGETIDSVSLLSVPPVDLAASTTDPVGTYQDDLQITGVTGGNSFDVNNYNLTFVNGDLKIDPRPITLTPDNQSKQYGDVLPLGTTAFSILDNGLTDGGNSTLPNGETIDNVTLLSVGGLAASTDQDASPTPYADNLEIDSNNFGDGNGGSGFQVSNYDITFATGDLTINPRQIELIAGRQEKFYGDGLNLDNTNFSVVDQGNPLDSALPNGEEITTVSISSATGKDASTNADASLYSNEIVIASPVTGTPGTGDGFLESNYDITFTSGDLLINPRPITVTPSQQEKTYGDVYTLRNDNTAFTVLDKDGGAILPNGETVDTVNIISRGGHDASTTSNALVYPDDLQITSFGTGGSGFKASNYTFDFTNLGDFVINRRAATINATAQRKDYGDVHDLGDTAFTVIDRDGGALPNGETIDTVTLVSAGGVDASTDADAATYIDNITVTPTSTGNPTLAGSNGFNQENYTFSYGAADFTIDPRAITLTASQQEKIYGDTLTLDNTAFTTLDKTGGTMLPNGEVITTVTISSASGVDASTTADAATYTDEIVISGPVTGTAGTGDGFLESNYDINYVTGDLVVNKRGITLTALPQGKIYGENVSPGTSAFTVTDMTNGSTLPNGETIDAVAITSAVAGDTSADVGVYVDDLAPTTILASSMGFDEANYNITRVNGDYTIAARAITITATEQSKIYGQSESLDSSSFELFDPLSNSANLPNGESVTAIDFAMTTLPGSTTAAVGTYTDALTPVGQTGTNGFKASNYAISYQSGDYVINRRAIELAINSDQRYAGASYKIDPTAFVTTDLVGGGNILPNGETVDSLDIFSVTGVAEDLAAAHGFYPAELDADAASALGSNGFDLNNYTVTVIPGDFTIDPYPSLPALSQEGLMEIWIQENIGYDPNSPFSNSYAISQSVGLRLIALPSWSKLSKSKQQAVLKSLDGVPLHLQTLGLAEKLINSVQ